MAIFSNIDRCALVGMVHLAPLPGSPGWNGDIAEIVQRAQRDAEALIDGGCDALIVENMGDLPYLRGRVDPETVAAMTVATAEVVGLGKPVGVQCLAAANREALGIALASGASFIRVEAFAYAHVADEGWLDACAGELVRARRNLGADVKIWADVHKKHAAHAVTADVPLADLARGHAFCGADVLIATGTETGQPTSQAEIEQIAAARLPVAVGSGVTDTDARQLAAVADALIVGTWLKEEGDWRNPVDVTRVRRIAKATKQLVA